MDEGQLALLQYAGWYKALYSMPLEHRPDDDVIQDDIRLDSWHKTFQRDQAKKAGRSGDANYSLTGESEDFQLPEFGV